MITEIPEAKPSLKTLMRPQMLGAYALYFATCYAYYLTDTWLPNFLSTERGFEGATIGLASSMVFFAAIPGALFFSRIADKFSHKKVSLIIIFGNSRSHHAFLGSSGSQPSVIDGRTDFLWFFRKAGG